MFKLMIILSLILSLGGVVFAQEEEARELDELLRAMFPEAVIIVGPANTLFVKAPPAVQEKIEGLIEDWERRLDFIDDFQITIEAKFVELTVTDIHELGVDLDIENISTLEGDMDIENPWVARKAAGISLGLTRLGPPLLNVVLRALDKQGKVDILSAPRVTTLNRHPTTISIEREIPYISGRERENVGTAEHPRWLITYEMDHQVASIKLEVIPTVPEGSELIELSLSPMVRTLVRRIPVFPEVAPEHDWPIMDERSARTSLVVRSGETIVLGGLIRNRVEEKEERVPLLGDIPFLGRAFRHTYSREEKNNLLIFITAYLVCPRGERM